VLDLLNRPEHRESKLTSEPSRTQLKNVEKLGWTQRPLGNLKLAFRQAPLTVGAIATVPFAAMIVLLTDGYGTFAVLRGAIAHPSGMTAACAVLAACYALIAIVALDSAKESALREERDRKADLRQERALDLLQQAARESGIANDRLNRWTGDQAGRLEALSAEVEVLHDAIASFRAERAPKSKTGPNTTHTWSDYAPGSTCYNIGGQGRKDLECVRRPDGTLQLLPDWDRIAHTWYRRFKAETAVGKAFIVIFMGEPGGMVPDQLAVHLTIFRAIKILAERLGGQLCLDRARFYLVYGRKPAESVFVGEHLLPNGERRRFVHSYSDPVERYAIPSVLQDNRVLTSYESEDIDAALAIINAVIAGLPGYSLQQLEDLFGHRVSGPEPPATGFYAELSPRPPVFAKHKPGCEISNGDHFTL
jgi:hypothetical protein